MPSFFLADIILSDGHDAIGRYNKARQTDMQSAFPQSNKLLSDKKAREERGNIFKKKYFPHFLARRQVFLRASKCLSGRC